MTAEFRHLGAFLEMMVAERGASKNTYDAYHRDLSRYLEFVGNAEQDGETASPETVRGFLADLAADGLAARTQARKLSAVRQFHGFLLVQILQGRIYVDRLFPNMGSSCLADM